MSHLLTPDWVGVGRNLRSAGLFPRSPFGQPRGLLVEKDLYNYNKVGFTPVTTSGLRLEVTMQSQWSAGVEKWKVK